MSTPFHCGELITLMKYWKMLGWLLARSNCFFTKSCSSPRSWAPFTSSAHSDVSSTSSSIVLSNDLTIRMDRFVKGLDFGSGLVNFALKPHLAMEMSEEKFP